MVLGPAAGGAAYGPALTDVVDPGPRGPGVRHRSRRRPLGDRRGRRRAATRRPRAARAPLRRRPRRDRPPNASALDEARRLAALLGDQGRLDVDRSRTATSPRFCRSRPSAPTTSTRWSSDLLDAGPALELHPRWAPNITTTLGRLGGRTVGVIANNPLRLGGCLDSPSAEKAARFVRMCDAFGVPLVVVVDVPGYLPGVGQEWDGVVRRGAKLLHAFAEATVPRVTLVTRKAYGGAYIAMNSRSLGATEGVRLADRRGGGHGRRRRRPDPAPPPARRGGSGLRAQVEAELAEEHERIAGGLAKAMEIGVVDEVVEPAATRSALARAIADAPARRGDHGNIPL